MGFRLIALFALAAVAVAEPEAEADPQWGYAPYAATYGAHSVYGYPYNTYGMYNTYNRGAYRYPYSTFGYRQLFKREAESEPEADPQWLLHNGFVQHANGAQVPQDTPSVHAAKVQHLTAKANEYALKGYVPHVATYGAPAVYRHPYNNYGMYNTYNYGVYRHPYTTSAYSHTPTPTTTLTTTTTTTSTELLILTPPTIHMLINTPYQDTSFKDARNIFSPILTRLL